MNVPPVAAALATAFSLAAASQVLGELTVKVDATSGAPRLVVNGQPVRARMFFGGPGSAPIKIEPEGRSVEFQFTAQNDAAGTGTLHFRFGQIPGEVFLDNIRIRDLASGIDLAPFSDFESGPDSFSRDWAVWPVGEANAVGTVTVDLGAGAGAGGSAGLHVKLRQPAKGEWPDWHIYHLPNLRLVRGHRYLVTFWARAEPARDVTVALYRPGNPFVYLGGPRSPFEAQIKMAAGVGVDFVSFPVGMPWPAPGEAEDWGPTDNACAQVLQANPKALLLPRLGADPPEWWRKAHPDEVMTWENGSQQSHAVVASPVYRRDAAARVAALVEHLENKFGDHMAGYHVCGQNTGEWFYQNTWENLGCSKRRPVGHRPFDYAILEKGRYARDELLSRTRDQVACRKRHFSTSRHH